MIVCGVSVPDVPVTLTVYVPAVVVVAVEIVTISLDPTDVGVTGFEELKEQLVPLGKLEQARLIPLLKPFSAVSVRT